MVIELSGVQFCMKLSAWFTFKIKRGCNASSIWIISMILDQNCMILSDSRSLSSPFPFVTSAQSLLLRTLSGSGGAIWFKIFSRWWDLHQLRKTFVYILSSRAGHILTMLIHSARVELLYCFIRNYQKPDNIYLFAMAQLWICRCQWFV